MFATVPIFVQPVLILIFNLTFFWLMAWIHELGHVFVGILFGGKCRVIREEKTFAALLTTHVTFPMPLGPFKNALFTMAGILSQVVVSVVLVLQTASLEMRIFALIYLAVIGMNIAPMKPSDGYYLNLLLKHGCLQHSSMVIHIVTWFQWMIFVGALIATFWYSILIFFWSDRTSGLEKLCFTVIGFLVVIFIIRRVKNLTTTPASFLYERGDPHE